MLAPGNSKVFGEHQQEQYQSTLAHAHASLHGYDSLDDWPLLRGGTGCGNYDGHQHHDQSCPFKQNRTQVFERVIRAKYIQKDFVNDLEPQRQAYRLQSPVAVEILLVSSKAIGRKHHAKIQDLKDEVIEENREDAMQLTPVENAGNSELQHRMRQPQSELKLCIHRKIHRRSS